MDRLNVSPSERFQVAARSQIHGTSFRAELLASDLVDERRLQIAVAEELDIPSLDIIDPEQLISRDAECLALLGQTADSHPAMIRNADGDTSILISLDRVGPKGMAETIFRAPHLKRRFRIASATVTRRALIARAQSLLLDEAVNGLANRYPELSARIVANAWQGYVVGAASVALPVGIYFNFDLTFTLLHTFASLFFLACVSLRFAAMKDAWLPKFTPIEPLDPAALPTYSVLVALYREAEVVPQLLIELGKLIWPRSKLEIKLVCEADDLETLAAIRSQPMRSCVEIIEVPPSGPRTKPKALSYALPTVSGELVVLYDAEDRPHPSQLLEAYQAFRSSGPDLACLQAPLKIANERGSMISRMFAFEYSALFNGMLPFLARGDLIFPLGGTSNHFRRSVLVQIGAWDPYNVTEDADLGLRFARMGYRCGVLTRPTLEDAPTRLSVWLPQRTRWFKGWLQTWLVHMRRPRSLLLDLKPASFFIAQILFLGMVASSLVHPLFFLSGLYFISILWMGVEPSTGQSLLLVVDITNVVSGYLSFLLLGWQTLEDRSRRHFWRIVVCTPVYWMMMSMAAWRAVWQLWRKPHLWEKTPHQRSSITT